MRMPASDSLPLLTVTSTVAAFLAAFLATCTPITTIAAIPIATTVAFPIFRRPFSR